MAKANAVSLNPFEKDAAIYKVWDMCAKGTTRDAIKAFCEKNEVGAPRMFHCMRREHYPTPNAKVTWEFTEADGNIQLQSIKAVVAKKAPAAATAAKAKAKVA